MGNSLQKDGHYSEHQSAPVESFTCEICIEPMLLADKKFKNHNRCVHPFCTDCMVKYISVKLEDNIGDIPCPSLNCDKFFDPLSCQTLVGPQVFVKWCDVLCESSLLGLPHCYCPNRDCSALILDECGGNAKRSKCPNCKRLFCFGCKLPWHAGFHCEESPEFRDRNDVAFGMLAERNKWKRCPQCRRFVELIQGCKIVKCRCNADFCYNCGRRVYQHWCGCDSASSVCMWIFQSLLVLFVIMGFYFIWTHYSLSYKN